MRRLLFIFALFTAVNANAGNTAKDSARVAKRLISLLELCKKQAEQDSTFKQGSFSKAAGYVVYREEGDVKRRWKDTCNYTSEDERKAVDGICYRLHSNLNADPNYKIVKYQSETESEGTWMVLTVNYMKNGVAKKMMVAFLEIKGVLAIGDID
jgi:hypothetical protein